MKLKTLILINEWISHGTAANRSPDDNLHATPGGQNDGSPHWDDNASFDVNSSNIAESTKNWNSGVDSWDGIVEGKDWFCYVEGNDWNTKRSGATIYINEDEKPHKIWIKIKTGNLRKPNDTNESYKERVRKHTNKVARSWMSAARKIHNNPDINETGNPVPVTWKQAFREATKDGKLKKYMAECGEQEIIRKIEENVMSNKRISYSAVVLENRDQEKLLEFFKDIIPPDWSKYAHHMTITMGELPAEKKQDIGKTVTLTAYELGKSDMAIAVRVRGYWTTNSIAHVTLAVNKAAGGKPVDSNKITKWEPLPNTIPLNGVVTEISFKN